MKTSTIRGLKSGAAPLVLGLAMLAGPAFAQAAPQPADQPAAEEPASTIIVTGSIVRNAAAATASPVTSLSAQDLSTRGITTVSDALQQLTANNAGTDPSSWSPFGFATGASAVSLRGLSDAYTLTIFNNLRSAPYPLADDGYRNFVDANTIPDSIVERIDVLQDGASATYGADAVAGVVNVIVKKQITGLHLNASGAISQRGDAGERRADATYGFGKLDEDGYNVYINGEYQINDPLYMNQRGYPFNTADLSAFCGTANGLGSVAAGQQTCMTNSVLNGIQAGGGYNGFQSTTIPFVRQYAAPGVGATGPYQLLNPAAGCGGLTAVTLTAAQINGSTSTPQTVCQQDLAKQYYQYDPRIERWGANAKATFKVGSNAEAYAMFNFYDVKTANQYTPLNFAGATAAGGTTITTSQIYLPAYVCPTGTSTVVGGILSASGCTAANGTLNPNNPFAASGSVARLAARYDLPRQTFTDAKTYRISGGIDGSFGEGWNYDIGATASWVTLDTLQRNYIYLQGLMDAVAQGTYNFVNPSANSAAARQLIAPDNFNHSVSKLTQIVGTINKDFFKLPGGSLNLAVGAEYRYEAIHNPSANPANNANPTDRFYSVNSVGVDGSRSQYSLSYEITAPILDTLKVKAEGSYDHYSTGQSHFSPKFEAEFRPIRELKIRGTYSQGFRIPSFNEAFGLPTTGYVNTSINCATYVAFCAAHASNLSYTSGQYSYGLTSVGNPALAPEKSKSFTAGIVVTPTPRIQLTADFWYVKVTDVIIPALPSPAIFQQYYTNNGVVNIPGFTVTPGVADPLNPNALPLLGFIQASYQNADSLTAKGLDFSGRIALPLNSNGLKLNSTINASYLLRLQQVDAGAVERFDGTLGPCNITSCSGAPKWRVTWTNSLDFNNKGSVSLTAYYTSGVSEVATDEGGVYGDCTASVGAQVASYADGATPVVCNSKALFDLDGHAELKVQDHFKIYADIKNILNQRPTFDPGAAYGLYNFNPAWADSQFIGRFFRVGVKIDY